MTRKKTRNLTFDGDRWAYDVTRKGRRIRKGGFMTKAQAEAALARKMTNIMDIEVGLVKPAIEAVPFGKFADDFLRLYSKPNKRSWARDETTLAHARRFFKDRPLSQISGQDVEGYRAARSTDVSPSCINRETACLKTLFTKAVEWGKLEASPAAKVRRFREPASRERTLTSEEAGRLLEALSPTLKAIATVGLGTGMRRGEILALKWADIDLTRGVIAIVMSKSGKPRKVPVSAAVAEALAGIPRTGDLPFPTGGDNRSVSSLEKEFKATCHAVNLDGFRFHDLRHTFASRALELGADLVSVSKILGHASITMTGRYLHASGEAQRLAVEKVGGFLDSTRQKVDSRPGTEIPAPPVTPTPHDN